MLKDEIKKVFDELYKKYNPSEAEVGLEELVNTLFEKGDLFSPEEISSALTELVKEEWLEIRILTSVPPRIFVHFKKI